MMVTIIYSNEPSEGEFEEQVDVRLTPAVSMV